MVPTGSSKPYLIAYFLGQVDVPTERREVDTWREGLKGFVTERWQVLQPQLTCPIRKDLDACKGCLDAQVVSCVVEQRDYEPLIQLHRK
jgi:hypothetical protein